MIDNKFKLLTAGLVALALTSCTVPKTFMQGFENIPFPEQKNRYQTTPITQTEMQNKYAPAYAEECSKKPANDKLKY